MKYVRTFEVESFVETQDEKMEEFDPLFMGLDEFEHTPERSATRPHSAH